MKIFILSLLLLTQAAQAEHREHKAHKHGAAKIEMAFDGPNGEITLEAATQGIYGFEYAAKTEDEKKKQHNAYALLETNIGEMVKFDSSLKCEISKVKIELDQQKDVKHSDLDASFKVVCEKTPIGSTIVFNIQKTFPKLKDVQVIVVADDLQKMMSVKKNGDKLALKK